MTTSEILDAFPRLNALVVGDVCLDRWCRYDPAAGEESRETGIRRIGVVSTKVTPGAAGTVAKNLCSLGIGGVALLGIVGEDGHGYELMRALGGSEISTELIVRSSLIPTFTYTKLINNNTGKEDLPRVDYIYSHALPSAVEQQVAASLRMFSSHFDVIFVSDQAETEAGGVVTPLIRQTLAKIAEEQPEKLIWVDSRRRPEHFRRVILKPNRDEADAACLRAFGAIDYKRLREYTQSKLLIVTCGGEGALVIDDAGETLVPGRAVGEPVDVCGAGDSFSAGSALALLASKSPAEAVAFGNLVASITVMKPGTGVATPEELLAIQ